MPRLLITDDVRIQNRESQRRSRARRRELIDTLKERVEAYERNGVEATKQMQEVARRLDNENARLRKMLRRRGVSDEEIDWCLARQDEDEGLDEMPDDRLQREEIDGSGGPVRQGLPATAVEPSPGEEERRLSPQTQSKEASATPSTPLTHTTGTTPSTSSSQTTYEADFETPCDVAAAILVQLCGQTDEERARETLGCNGSDPCSVKNTKMFHLMNSII